MIPNMMDRAFLDGVDDSVNTRTSPHTGTYNMWSTHSTYYISAILYVPV